MRLMAEESDVPQADDLPHGNTPQSILSFLAEHRSGDTAVALGQELRDLVEALETHFNDFRGKVTGELNIKIKLVLENGVYKAIIISKTKRPDAPEAVAPMWLQSDGSLRTHNPRQLTMCFAGKPQSAT